MRVRTALIWGVALCLLVLNTAGAQEAGSPPAPSAPAAETPKPISLTDLLEQVRRGWRAERDQNRRREREFLGRKAEQAKLLRAAKATLLAEEKRSEQLELAFEGNEKRLAEFEKTLRERLGTLGELFGVVRSVAGDTLGHVEASIVSAQLPGRGEGLATLAQSKRLPSIDQLEFLWFALQQEMIESGKVVRFPATVVGIQGEERQREVVRVGAFNAVADGKYLEWRSDVGKLVELPRQPGARFLSSVSVLESATDGMVRFAIDPARGEILKLLVQTKNFSERIEDGGVIGYLIIGLGAVTGLLGLARLGYVLTQSRKVAVQRNDRTPRTNNPLGRVLAVFGEYRGTDPETLELKLEESILRESAKVERYLWAIKVVSVVAPLMGLLGTVTGMIRTFQAITLFGTGDPKTMAGGISEALVTTMLGLIVAIPLVLLHSWVSSLSRGVTDVLEEESAGLIAARAEGGETGEAAA